MVVATDKVRISGRVRVWRITGYIIEFFLKKTKETIMQLSVMEKYDKWDMCEETVNIKEILIDKCR
jgi:hypothetical protein